MDKRKIVITLETNTDAGIGRCPCCGGEAVVKGSSESYFFNFKEHYSQHYEVTCLECGLSITREKEDAAINAWNRRVS